MATAATARAASEEDNDGSSKSQETSNNHEPDDGAERGRAVVVGAVDTASDDLETSKVAGQGDEGNDKGKKGEEGGGKGAETASEDGEDEGDEAEASSDGVKDHDVGESGRGVFSRVGEAGAVDAGDDLGQVVADS